MDRRYTRTHELIRKTYLELIRKKMTLKVSISEIAREANIDRKTFYLHYDSVERIIDEYLESRVLEMADALEENRFFEDPFSVSSVLRIFHSTREVDIDLLRLVSGNGAYEDLWNRFHDVIVRKTIEIYAGRVTASPDEFRIYTDFFISGILGVYRKWLQNEYKTDIQKVTEVVTQVAHFGVLKILA